MRRSPPRRIVFVMFGRRPRDEKLDHLRRLTGIRDQHELLMLGRLGDLVDAAGGEAVLTDWIGEPHAVAVLEGSCRVGTTGYVAGDVFVASAWSAVHASPSATLLVAGPGAATDLRGLLGPAVSRSSPAKRPSSLRLPSRPRTREMDAVV